MALSNELKNNLQQLITEKPIVVFMKGTKTFPQCGFSAAVVEVLKRLNAPFHDVNVLEDPSLREGIKEFTNWPTIPQVYIGGKFVGGCDIVRDMYQSGELEPLVHAAITKSS